MHQREQHEQSDGSLNRPKGAIRPSDRWMPAELAAARKHYDAAQEGHISSLCIQLKSVLRYPEHGPSTFPAQKSSFRVARDHSPSDNANWPTPGN
jgi:hypothetical protein